MRSTHENPYSPVPLESISLRRLDAVLRLKIHWGMKFGAKKTPSLISSITCTRNGLPTAIPTFSDRLSKHRSENLNTRFNCKILIQDIYFSV